MILKLLLLFAICYAAYTAVSIAMIIRRINRPTRYRDIA